MLNVQRLSDAIVFPFINYEWNKGIHMLYNGDHINNIHDQSIGIHWYGGAPLSQIYNNVINPITIHNTNNTITLMLRRI
jgi:hypothetical protein